MWKILIPSIGKLIILVLTQLLERNAEKRKLRKEAAKEVVKGIKERDPSKITAGFDKLNRN